MDNDYTDTFDTVKDDVSQGEGFLQDRGQSLREGVQDGDVLRQDTTGLDREEDRVEPDDFSDAHDDDDEGLMDKLKSKFS